MAIPKGMAIPQFAYDLSRGERKAKMRDKVRELGARDFLRDAMERAPELFDGGNNPLANPPNLAGMGRGRGMGGGGGGGGAAQGPQIAGDPFFSTEEPGFGKMSSGVKAENINPDWQAREESLDSTRSQAEIQKSMEEGAYGKPGGGSLSELERENLKFQNTLALEEMKLHQNRMADIDKQIIEQRKIHDDLAAKAMEGPISSDQLDALKKAKTSIDGLTKQKDDAYAMSLQTIRQRMKAMNNQPAAQAPAQTEDIRKPKYDDKGNKYYGNVPGSGETPSPVRDDLMKREKAAKAFEKTAKESKSLNQAAEAATPPKAPKAMPKGIEALVKAHGKGGATGSFPEKKDVLDMTLPEAANAAAAAAAEEVKKAGGKVVEAGKATAEKAKEVETAIKTKPIRELIGRKKKNKRSSRGSSGGF